MRLAWLDSAKGIGIILVVMIHSTINPGVLNFIGSFIMQLFFFLSGIVFHFSRKEQFIQRHARSILTPYFVFCILSFLYWIILERHFRPSDFSPMDAFLNIFIAQGGKYIFNAVMWFLPCLFVVEVLFYYIRKNVRSDALVILITLVLMAAGYMLRGNLQVRLPWMFDAALISIFFYALGAMFARSQFMVQERSKSTLMAVSLVSLALCVGLATFFTTITNLAEYIFPNPLLLLLSSFTGTIAVIAMAMSFPAPWTQKLGRMALLIMCIHEPVKRILLKIAETISGIPITDLRTWIPTSIAIAVVTASMSILLALCINRFFPWATGQKAR